MSYPLTVHTGTTRRLRGSGSLLFFTVSASAPMTVLAGGILATYAVSGLVGVPLSFPILALALGLFTVGYAAMSRHVSNAGALYAYLAKGLGGAFGVAGSFIALVAYNGIQIGLYGLFGFLTSIFCQVHFSLTWSWWVYSLIAWAVVGLLGVLRVDLNASVLGIFLIAEVIAVVLFDVGAISKPAGGTLSLAGFQPHNLFTSGVGAVFAFGIAAFVGFESGTSYSEEVRDSRRTVARATYGALLITGILYSVSAWAMTLSVGADKVVDTARDPNGGLPFAQLAGYFGDWVGTAANVLFSTSVFAALLSFHNTIARYSLALGRERVLPSFLGQKGRGSGAPIAGSLMQSLLAIIVVVVFAVMKKDPFTELFTWLSYIGAVGVVLLMLGGSVAVIGYFARRPGSIENAWQRVIAPVLATLALGGILGIIVLNSDALLGAEKGSALTYILPGIVGAAAILGLFWGLIIKATRPEVYANIGRGIGDDDDELEGPSGGVPMARHGAPETGRRLQV
jgi:amino acid transporter